MRKLLGVLAAVFLSTTAFAADLSAQTLPVKATPTTCVAGNCSGWYATFGVDGNADLGGVLNNSSTNGMGLAAGGGYQFWSGQVLAGIEVTGGYEFGTAGSVGTMTSTQFVKLGYNFFPSTASAPTTPSQSPLQSLVPANLLANSTPAFIFGGALRHGIEQGAIGAEIDTVIASGWSTAFQYYNAPSFKGEPDENVFRIMVQKHF